MEKLYCEVCAESHEASLENSGNTIYCNICREMKKHVKLETILREMKQRINSLEQVVNRTIRNF